jgi:hypothetical protein
MAQRDKDDKLITSPSTRLRVFHSLWAAAAIAAAAHLAGQPGGPKATDVTILINEVTPAPEWAVVQREMLEAAGASARLWVDRYVRPDGSVNVPERWGVTDGPDDIMETVRGWPLAHAMGAPDSVADAFEKVWEGHLRQFGRAKIAAVELAKDGIFVKEFPPSFDWEHIGEGLQAFYWHALSRPRSRANLARARRFAGFYLNEDPGAPNYDPRHKIIKSLFNGSKGPVTRPVTPVDWDGDENPTRAARFSTSSNIRGDHPLNLLAVTLATHAYLLTHESKYKQWALEYVDAWGDRAAANGGNFPSNIGLDGTIGGEWEGKWYGGIFGWNSPDEGRRNYTLRGVPAAFGQAAMLSGKMTYVDTIRRQADNIFAAARTENGEVQLPHYYGEAGGSVGWYGYRAGEFFPTGALGNLSEMTVELYLWSLSPSDAQRILPNPPDRRSVQGWIEFLQGRRPGYPLEAMQQDRRDVARSVERARDRATGYGPSPVAFESLANLTLGAANLYGSGDVLRSQVRYFDPDRRRAGLAQDVAALVDSIGPDSVTLTLVNTNASTPRRLIVQMGAYGEHQTVSVRQGNRTILVGAPYFAVRLAAGAGEQLVVTLRRLANDPTLQFPWERRQ